MNKKYSVSIFWSDEDEGFIALSPEFPGLSAFGETYAEAGKEVGDAINAMIASHEKYGDPLPEPKKISEHSGQFRIRIPKSLHTALALEASRQSVSLNSFITGVLAESMGQQTVMSTILREIEDLKKVVNLTCSEVVELRQKPHSEGFFSKQHGIFELQFKHKERSVNFIPQYRQ